MNGFAPLSPLGALSRRRFVPAVAADYAALILADSPVAYWRLGDGAGPTAADETGNYPGTYANVWAWVTGAIQGDSDTSGEFGGVNSRVVTSASGISALPVTFEAWVKPATLSGSHTMVCVGRDNTSRNILYFEQSFKRPELYRFIDGSFSNVSIGADFFNTADIWYHVAATMDAAGAVKIYGNGSQIGSGSMSASFPSSTNRMAVGAFIDSNGSFLNHFNGAIDEVAIYSYALSGAQILAHYNAGMGI